MALFLDLALKHLSQAICKVKWVYGLTAELKFCVLYGEVFCFAPFL